MTTTPADLARAMGVDMTPQYVPAPGDRIPIEQWGSDHWSTLAYLETRIVDHKGQIEHDHMRCHPARHPGMYAAKRRCFGASGDGSRYPTRLRDGEAADHDDYDCIDDMIAEGLVTVTMPPVPSDVLVTGLVESTLAARATYSLTATGVAMASRLRQHRASGQPYRTFLCAS